MSTNETPAQTYDHFLEALKGWPSPYALDFAAPLEVSEHVAAVAGRVCTLNAAGQLELGLLSQSMPIFIRQAENENDVSAYPGATAGRRFGSNAPMVSGLVATGGYELQTTEYYGSSFAPNDPLTSTHIDETGSGTYDQAGRLRKCNGYYYDDVCGVVSLGLVTSRHPVNKTVLQFWSYFLPKNPQNATVY